MTALLMVDENFVIEAIAVGYYIVLCLAIDPVSYLAHKKYIFNEITPNDDV